MLLNRQLHLAALLCGLLSMAIASLPAFSQYKFPDHPIGLIVPFPPGAGGDNLARAIAPKAAQILGESIVIENKPGAGGDIGAVDVAHAAPDGYTLLQGTNGTMGINQALHKNTGFDPFKDFVPVSRFTEIPLMLVVNPKMPANNVKELIAYIKANAGKVAFGSAGNGTTSHLAGVQFRNLAGTDILYVPYKGGGAAKAGLLAVTCR